MFAAMSRVPMSRQAPAESQPCAVIHCMTNRRAKSLLVLLLAATCCAASATPVVRFHSSYIDGLFERQVTADAREPLVTAEEFDLGGRKDEALHLREFVERRVWLAALSEPPPPGGTVRDVLAAKWPEYLPQLRARGAARLLPITVLGAWLEGEPQTAFGGVADAGYTNDTGSGSMRRAAGGGRQRPGLARDPDLMPRPLAGAVRMHDVLAHVEAGLLQILREDPIGARRPDG
jgi:hypothetical protein